MALTLAAPVGLLFAGPLAPPAGPVTSTMKTLTEVEPRIAINPTNTPGTVDSIFRISQPGSYYLTANVVGQDQRHGIKITASGVTIDLNGFDLVGSPFSLDGIAADAPGLRNITIRNGSIRNWGDDGIDLLTSSVVNAHVENVVAAENGSDGIDVAGPSIVTKCTAYGNAAVGIQTTYGSIVSECTSTFNDGKGIKVTDASVVKDCTTRGNNLDGIECGSWNQIRDNTCSLNGNGADGAGIHVLGSDNRIEGNSCSAADRGIDVDSIGNFIVSNICSSNTVNWAIMTNNYYGPIIDRASVVTPAVNGNSAASALATTDPHANFTY